MAKHGSPGEKNCKAKLTAEDVRTIRRSSLSQSALAGRFGVHVDTISNVRIRKTWKHINDWADIPVVPSLPGEEWRAVTLEPFLRRYEVSSFGRVRQCGRGIHLPALIIKPRLDDDGYERLTLYVNESRREISIHMLVAWAFIGPKPPSLQVNHRDGYKSNNRADNLEYVTPADNVRHAITMGLMPQSSPRQ